MIIKILTGAILRAFTKKNGAVISTTVDGQWDLEATLAWFIRGLLLIGLLAIAKHFGVEFDPATI